MFVTAARKEVIDFSEPVYTYGEGLVVPKTDTKDYAKLEDLKGEAVGAQVGTAFVDALKKTGTVQRGQGLRHHPGHPARREYRPPQGRLRRLPDPRLQSEAGHFPRSAAGGILQADHRRLGRHRACARATRNCSTKINASLAKLKANGAVDKILDKWGLKPEASLIAAHEERYVDGLAARVMTRCKASCATPSSSCRSCCRASG